MTTWDKPIELESSTTSKDDVFIPTEYLTPGNTSIENVIVEEVISNANHNVPTTTKEIHGFIPTEDEKDDAIDEVRKSAHLYIYIYIYLFIYLFPFLINILLEIRVLYRDTRWYCYNCRSSLRYQ